MKICRKCGKEKSLSEYYRKTSGKDGYSARCKLCEGKGVRKYAKANSKQIRERNIKARYGLEPKGFYEMIELQQNKCAICFSSFEHEKLCVDHDHDTGKVRGLLCSGCNMALGGFGDNPWTVLNAHNYLIQNDIIARQNR